MKTAIPSPATDRRALLSAILKSLRRRRDMKSSEVAAAMGMPQRSYEFFEAGQGRFDMDRLHRFAEAVDADPYAILFALEIGSAKFAVRCADNKAATVFLIALQDFDAHVGDDLLRLDPHTLMAAFTRAFDGLRHTATERVALLESWMSDPILTGEQEAAPPARQPQDEEE